MARLDDRGLLRFSELVDGATNSRKPLWIVVMADQETSVANLRPPSPDVRLDGFVAVFTVDEDEVEFSVLEAAGGFD